LNAKDSLTRLLTIQNLARQIRRATEEIDNAPARIEEIEGRFRERNTEYVSLRDRYEEIESDRRVRDDELVDLEESRKKFMADLMQVKNQREYAAMLKEIDVVKARIAEHEDAILKEMEEAEWPSSGSRKPAPSGYESSPSSPNPCVPAFTASRPTATDCSWQGSRTARVRHATCASGRRPSRRSSRLPKFTSAASASASSTSSPP
jgi:hypothetical protein